MSTLWPQSILKTVFSLGLNWFHLGISFRIYRYGIYIKRVALTILNGKKKHNIAAKCLPWIAILIERDTLGHKICRLLTADDWCDQRHSIPEISQLQFAYNLPADREIYSGSDRFIDSCQMCARLSKQGTRSQKKRFLTNIDMLFFPNFCFNTLAKCSFIQRKFFFLSASK